MARPRVYKILLTLEERDILDKTIKNKTLAEPFSTVVKSFVL